MKRIPEIIVPGKRLGRHVYHDPRSLAYLAPEAAAVSVKWERHIPYLNQLATSACTGNATVGCLGSGPLYDALLATGALAQLNLDENLALSIYSDAEILDGGVGLPTEDDGSYGISVAKVAVKRKLASGYVHATSVDQAHGALQAGPVMFGTNWYSGMDNPTSEGIVTATGTVRGGHEYECREYDASRDLWWCDQSWGNWGLGGRFAYDTPTLMKLMSEDGDVTALKPITVPAPVPTPPVDPDQRYKLDAFTWASKRHSGINKTFAKETLAWLGQS